MTTHETVRQLLALSAAGFLDAADERRVREHVRECAACAAALDDLAAVSADLCHLPTPVTPPDLLARTQARVARNWRPRPASATVQSWRWARPFCLDGGPGHLGPLPVSNRQRRLAGVAGADHRPRIHGGRSGGYYVRFPPPFERSA